MKKSIEIYRSELVWQDRRVSWEESDYQGYLDWLKSFENKQDGAWSRNNYELYLFLKEYSWNDVCYWFDHEGDDEEPRFKFHNDLQDAEYSWTSSLSDIVKDAMREDVYNCEICNEEYADDYNEDWRVSEVDDD